MINCERSGDHLSAPPDDAPLPFCPDCQRQLTDAEYQWLDGVHCKYCQPQPTPLIEDEE